MGTILTQVRFPYSAFGARRTLDVPSASGGVVELVRAEVHSARSREFTEKEGGDEVVPLEREAAPGRRPRLLASAACALVLAIPVPAAGVQDTVTVLPAVQPQLQLQLHLQVPPHLQANPGEQSLQQVTPALHADTVWAAPVLSGLATGALRDQDYLRMQVRPRVQGAVAVPPRFVLPDTFRVPDPVGGPSLRFVPVAELLGSGLVMTSDPELHFRGTVFIGLEAADAPGSRARLGQAVRVHVLGGVDGSDPESLNLDSIGPLLPVQVVVRGTLDRDTVLLRLLLSVPGGTNDHAIEIPLRLDRPRILVRAPGSILGFGLERGFVVVAMPADAPEGRWPIQATVAAGRATVSPAILSLERGQVDTIWVRSAGIGGARIVIDGHPLGPGEATIDYGLPLALLAVALVGGLLGGFLSGAWRSTGHRWSFEHGALGAGSGLVVVVAYAVGLNLLNLDLGEGAAEAVAFTLGVAGGAVGPRVVRLFGGISRHTSPLPGGTPS